MWAGAAGILLLSVLLRWNSYDAPLVRDEGEYAYAAQLLGQGIAPYEHAFLQKPPMAIYTYALADMLAPGRFWAPRVLAWGFALVATVLLGAIARREWGAGCALPAMWVFTPLILLPGIEEFTANTEVFMLLPLLGVIALYVFNRERGEAAGLWFAVGFVGATTVLYKYTSGGLVLVVCAVWMVETARRGRLRRARLAWLGLSGLLGASLGAAVILGFFFVRDGGRHWWECTVEFNRFYRSSGSFGLDALRFRAAEFWTHWWVICVLPLALLVRPHGRLWFWFGLFAVACLSTAMSWYGHYYITVMPFWAALTAAAIQRVATEAGRKLRWPECWLRRGLTAGVVLVLCWPDIAWVSRSQEEFYSRKFPDHPFAEAVAVGRRVAELTGPRDYVYVAGSEPEILRYARRVSPTRFVIAYPLMIPTPLAVSYQSEAIRELQERPPAVIVLARSATSWLREPGSPPEFQAYLQKTLAQSYQAVGGVVKDGASAHWEEPLPTQDFRRSTLVVFKRVPGAGAAQL